MNISISGELFNAGILLKARIVPEPMSNGFSLSFTKTNGEVFFVTRAKTNDTKIYKREVAAMSDAKKVGFEEVIVSLS